MLIQTVFLIKNQLKLLINDQHNLTCCLLRMAHRDPDIKLNIQIDSRLLLLAGTLESFALFLIFPLCNCIPVMGQISDWHSSCMCTGQMKHFNLNVWKFKFKLQVVYNMFHTMDWAHFLRCPTIWTSMFILTFWMITYCPLATYLHEYA